MKITQVDVLTKRVGDIPPGGCFLFEGTIFLKLKGVSDPNCVELETGLPIKIDTDLAVRTISEEFRYRLT